MITLHLYNMQIIFLSSIQHEIIRNNGKISKLHSDKFLRLFYWEYETWILAWKKDVDWSIW